MTDFKWMDKALCLEYDPELWFHVTGIRAQQAKDICRECPVILECRIYSLSLRMTRAEDYLYGTWGGLNRLDRRDKKKAQARLEEASKMLTKRMSYG